MNTTPPYTRYAVIGVAIICVLIVGSLLAHRFIVQNMVMNDTMSRYTGCSGYFFRGESPYSEEASAAMRAFIGEGNHFYLDEERFFYPAHLCLVLTPIFLLPYDAAAGLWIFLLLAFFVVLPGGYAKLMFDYNVPPLRLVALMLSVLLGYRYVLMTTLLGQYSGLIVMGLVGATWALVARRWLVAALCLAAMTVRPDGGILAVGLVGLALYDRQYRVAVAWVAVMVALWLGTYLFIGSWEADFLEGVRAYASFQVDTRWLPSVLGSVGSVILILLGMAWTGAVVLRLRRLSREAQVIWAASLMALLVLVFVTQTFPYTLIYALPVYVCVMYAFRHRLALWLLGLATLSSTWLFYLAGQRVPYGDQLFYPIAIGVLALLALIYGKPEPIAAPSS